MQNPSSSEVIGENLKRLRTMFGYSQRDIAEQLGTSFQQVQKYERGQNRISAENLHKLKIFFGVPYAHFFMGLDMPIQNLHSEELNTLLNSKLNSISSAEYKTKLLQAFIILAS
ncbi:MAG: helix-turn-helix transcriptional regulator [Pseudomonadota bacterium]